MVTTLIADITPERRFYLSGYAYVVHINISRGLTITKEKESGAPGGAFSVFSRYEEKYYSFFIVDIIRNPGCNRTGNLPGGFGVG